MYFSRLSKLAKHDTIDPKGQTMADTEESDKPERETLQLFDLMFKFLLKEASATALVHFINGLFDKDYPLDSKVSFPATESVQAQPQKQGLEKIQSDIIVGINSDAFAIEAQIGDDETIALRAFQYGFAYAKQNMRISEDESHIGLKMPFARILYWETTRKTPDKVTLELEFEDRSLHTYEVKTLKMLDQSLEMLEQRKMMLLLPFCLLKFRKEVKKRNTTSEKRKQLAEEMKDLLHKLEKLIDHSRAQGLLSNGDAGMVMDRIGQMHDELYNPYPEFEEARMELQERLRTHWQDYYVEGERKGEQKNRDKILELIDKKNYTLEQIREILIQEAQQTATTMQQ